MLLGVFFGCVFVMLIGVKSMSVRDRGVVCGLLVVPRLVMLSCFAPCSWCCAAFS